MSHLDPVLILSSILVIAGFFIRLVIARSRFNRRGAGGLQHSSNYWCSLLMGILEWIFGKLAFAMILFGLLLMGIYFFNQCHAKKHRGTHVKGINP